MKQRLVLLTYAAAVALLPATASAQTRDAERPPYRSPLDLAFSPDGGLLAVSDRTAGSVAFIDVRSRKISERVALRGQPTGVAWSDAGKAFVAEYGAGTVAEVDPAAGKTVRRLQVGPKPVGVAVAAGRRLLIAVDSGLNKVSAVDLDSGTEKKRIDVVHLPQFVAITPEETTAVVGNLLPLGSAGDFGSAAAVSLIDLERLENIADVQMPAGSTGIRELAVSADGKWAYAVHTIGHVALPTIQLHQGWVNTNALSIIDLCRKKLYATVLLDHLRQGAADPWGVAISGDGSVLWATLAGGHQLAKLDLAGLHALLAGTADEEIIRRSRMSETPSTFDIWHQIKEYPGNLEFLPYDIPALSSADLLKRTDLPGKGPRGLDLSPDGKLLAAAAYYSGEVLLIDTRAGKVAARISMGPSAEADLARRGEILFHDATVALEGWLSCATCHPEGRADGLNWDLLNDGFGNPKNAKSLLLSHRTPPAMATGVRPGHAAAIDAGFRFILFHEPRPEENRAVEAYIRSLRPEPSPYLSGGQLSESARSGKAIFESPTAGCARCHPRPLLTDLQVHDVGTKDQLDHTPSFDTPTLVELWRTGPYLHHGKARTLREVFTKFNRQDRHGKTSHLSKDELDALVAYLLSL